MSHDPGPPPSNLKTWKPDKEGNILVPHQWLTWLFNQYEWIRDNMGVPFNLSTAMGRETGFTGLNKFGANTAVAATTFPGETVWDGSTDYDTTPTIPAYGNAPITHVDVDAGTCSSTLQLEGVAINGAALAQSATLNDTTPVALGTAMAFVNRMWIEGATPSAGNVRAHDNGGGPVVYSRITFGNNQTEQSIYYVPVGKTFYLDRWYMDLNNTGGTAAASTFILFAQDIGNGNDKRVHQTLGTVITGSSHIGHVFPTPWAISENWVVYVNCIKDAGTGDLNVSGGFEGYLVDN